MYILMISFIKFYVSQLSNPCIAKKVFCFTKKVKKNCTACKMKRYYRTTAKAVHLLPVLLFESKIKVDLQVLYYITYDTELKYNEKTQNQINIKVNSRGVKYW